jgi:hypothetical protein
MSSDFPKMSAMEMKESIAMSEGRVIMAQNFGMSEGLGLMFRFTNSELEASFGADMIMLNGYNLHPDPTGQKSSRFWNADGNNRLRDVKKRIGIPVGIYYEATNLDLNHPGPGMEQYVELLKNRIATKDNLSKALDEEADFVVIGGNPGTGTPYENIIQAVKDAKEVLGDKAMILAGKWEDGYTIPVLGDPMNELSSKDIIRDLIDAGADCITMPAPGSRTGITVEMIRELVEFVHRYKKGTLCLDFLDGCIEGTDTDTIREIGLLMKQTGADIHAIGDGGLMGCTIPENLYQLSITLKGRMHTWTRMMGRYR